MGKIVDVEGLGAQTRGGSLERVDHSPLQALCESGGIEEEAIFLLRADFLSQGLVLAWVHGQCNGSVLVVLDRLGDEFWQS